MVHNGQLWTMRSYACPRELQMKFYTIAEIAKKCKLSEKTIRREIKANRLHARKIAGQWRITEADYQDWIDRYQNFIPENTTAPGQFETNPSTNPQPDKSAPQAENEPNLANTDNEKPGKPSASDDEEVDDNETTKNAELYIAHWYKISHNKRHARNGHLEDSIKDKVEQLIRESNNDLKDNLLTVRIFFYLHDQKLIKGNRALPLADYIKRNYHLIYTYPQLTEEEEKDLDRAMEAQEIHCRRCDKITRFPRPPEKYACSKCGELKEMDIEHQAIKDDDMGAYPVLKLFTDKYHDILIRSQKQIQTRKREDYKLVLKKKQMDKRYMKPEENPNTLDWTIVGGMYDMKNEVYDPEYLKSLGIGE